ncbi:Molybdopterin oxidoreductase Fe4S4 region [Caminibacter mediatlanticus TB-2]|nr:Molybdopterin oxidoreductase Fe4S4 region [Caminibacter mediatlanticus TB-2]
MTNDLAEFATDTDVFLLVGTNTSECHPIIAMQIQRGLERGAKLIVIDPRGIDMAKKADVYIPVPVGRNIPVINAMIYHIIKNELYDKEFVEKYSKGFEYLKKSVEEFTPERVAKEYDLNAEDIKKAAELYAKGNPSAICYTMGVTQFSYGTYQVFQMSNLAILTGNLGVKGGGVNPLRGQNNVQGAGDMGALPNTLPGGPLTNDEYRKHVESVWGFKINPNPGWTLTEAPHKMEEGLIKCLYIFGENPVMSDPWTDHFLEALCHVDFIVVQDIFLTETAQRADVVLPAACWSEKEGTFNNTSRRVQYLSAAVTPPANLEPDWKVICNVANRIGLKGFDFLRAEEIWNEVRKVCPSKFGGISYERIKKLNGINWPCPDEEHPGTPYLYADKKSMLPDGKFVLVPVGFSEDGDRDILEEEFRKKIGAPDDYLVGVGVPSEKPNEVYPCMFTTGRKVYHYHTGTMTRECKPLEMGADIMGATIEISQDIADERGIETGDYVKVWNKRGLIAAKAVVRPDMRYGTIFTTFHYAEADGNELVPPEPLDKLAKTPPLKMSIANIQKISEEEFLKIRKELLQQMEAEYAKCVRS